MRSGHVCPHELPPIMLRHGPASARVTAAAAAAISKTAPADFVDPAHSSIAPASLLLLLRKPPHDYKIKIQYVEGCAALGKLLEPQDCVTHILPVIVNFSQDKSWRVRFMVANQLYELCEAVGPEPTRADRVPAYVRLLRDNEAEVRIAAAGKVTKFCRILSPQLAIQHILPCVKELSSDSSQHVRSALASVIMGMAPVLGKVLQSLNSVKPEEVVISQYDGYMDDPGGFCLVF